MIVLKIKKEKRFDYRLTILMSPIPSNCSPSVVEPARVINPVSLRGMSLAASQTIDESRCNTASSKPSFSCMVRCWFVLESLFPHPNIRGHKIPSTLLIMLGV